LTLQLDEYTHNSNTFFANSRQISHNTFLSYQHRSR